MILVIKTSEDKDGGKIELFVLCVLVHYTLWGGRVAETV